MNSFHFILSLIVVIGWTACDSSHSGSMPLSMYENDVAEAAVRNLMEHVPDPSPNAPKSWTIVFGEIHKSGYFHAASVPFLERFADTKKRLISAQVLSRSDPEQMIIDPELRVAVYILQVKHMQQRAPDVWDLEMGWSYKTFFERLQYVVTKDEQGVWQVSAQEQIEGKLPEPQ